MILLTALPHTGKSTAIKKIIELLGTSNCGGFYTEEIRENDERVGFMIKTLSNKEGVLAHTNLQSEYKISRYGVDVNKFEELCLVEINKSINDDNIKYLIIDEIGPMELFSNRYKELLIELLNSKKPVIGTIYMNSYEWLDDFKKKEGVNLIELTLDNRDQMPSKIVDMVLNK